MAEDRRKKLEAAERLLLSGKVQAALLEFEDLARSSPRDILTLNRVGDVLAKQGRNTDAVVYYRQIADQFAKGGFVPKAIAIHKKILRLTPDAPESLFSLGNLYAEQRLPGEARTHLLRAAELQLHARRFGEARKAYERLAALEPDDPRHRVRLAEARAAEGETQEAGRELIALAEWLLTRGKHDDAERTYRRAAELVPQDPGPTLGIARCLEARGDTGGALAALDGAASAGAPPHTILGARLALLDRAGRSAEVATLLGDPREVPDGAIVDLFRGAVERGDAQSAWNRYGAALESFVGKGAQERLERIYRAIGALESQGHLPALEALYRVREPRRGPELEEARGLLLRAYASRSMDREARALLEASSALVTPASPVAPPQRSEATSQAEADSPPPGAAAPRSAADLEAPAVPLTRTDEEFVAGRLTQAEILEKYGLRDEALRQLREISERYPGHVPIQERLVDCLREGAPRATMRDALVGLALARRAAGDLEGARRAAGEATTIQALEPATREALVRLGLVGRPSPPEPARRAPRGSEARPKPAPTPVGRDAGRAVVIDFDDAEESKEVEPTLPVAPVAPPQSSVPARSAVSARAAEAAPQVRRTPGADVLCEIGALLDGGAVDDAQRRIDALLTLGFEGQALDDLRVRASELARAQASVQRDVPTAGLFEDDDLGAITAALESELLAPEMSVATPDPESEQSLEEVFAAFRQHVATEIEGDDYRTHYDLGIAYKEMGLLEDSIEQFRRVLGSPELHAEALAMLAVCLRDAGRIEESVRSYREAIAACDHDDDISRSLRYELGDVLLVAGDADGALGEFRGVLASDPTFRDVRDRVAQLER